MLSALTPLFLATATIPGNAVPAELYLVVLIIAFTIFGIMAWGETKGIHVWLGIVNVLLWLMLQYASADFIPLFGYSGITGYFEAHSIWMVTICQIMFWFGIALFFYRALDFFFNWRQARLSKKRVALFGKEDEPD
jgi:hypothetical protein